MPPTLQFVYAIIVLIAEGSGLRMRMEAPKSASELEASEIGLDAAWTDLSHALRGKLASILIVLDKVLSLEISNVAAQLKFNPEIKDDHPVTGHLTLSLCFRKMELTIVGSATY